MTLTGPDVGAYLTWPRASTSTNGSVVELQVAISFVSVAQARINLFTEVGNASFSTVLSRAQDLWRSNDHLGLVELQGGSAELRTTVTTALYRVLNAPTRFSEPGAAKDARGRTSYTTYRGIDGRIHEARGWHYMSDLSIWDVMRTHFPLLTIIRPDVSEDIMRSMVEQAKQQGRLPKWILATGETDSMIGLHSVVMLADGLQAWSTRREANSTATEFNVSNIINISAASLYNAEGDSYHQQGYIPGNPCHTLAFSLDDQCMAQMAALGARHTLERQFRESSRSWRNVFNPSVKFFCPRNADGTWQVCRATTALRIHDSM